MDRHKYIRSGLKILDLVVMALCFAGAAILVAPGLDITTIRQFMELRISLGNFILFGTFITLWHLLFTALGLYEDVQFSDSYRKATDVLKASTIGTFAIVAVAVPFQISFVDARFMVIFYTSVSLLTFGTRLITRELLVHYNSQEENRRKILLIGVNKRSVRLARQIEAEQKLSYRLIGFVDDTAIHAPNFDDSGYHLVAPYQELAKYLGKTAMDEVLICLPVKSRSDDISDVVSVCEEQGIAVGVLSDLFEWNLATSDIRQIGRQTIMGVRPHAIYGGHAATKRSLDILISAMLIVLLLPVFIATALLIKLTSPGPVTFAQERVGLNKKRFRMLKFRTMVVDAEGQLAALERFNEAAGPVFKITSDPRITSVGKFLRKYSIDELPQLINVLKGDMSIVGPRPLPLRDYDGFTEDWHRRRISIRPGITGLWQVNGRDHNAFDQWMKLDLDYIDRWSLVLDLQVMLKTIPAVFKGSGK